MDSSQTSFSFMDEVFTGSLSMAILHGEALRLYRPTLLHVFSTFVFSYSPSL